MAEKLEINHGGTDVGKKLLENHQKNEYTRVNNYKEAVCLNCLKTDRAIATIATICGECAGKRGREPLLAVVSRKFYGLCLFCGEHRFHLEEINARFCTSCHGRIAKITREYNKKGGTMGTDPFWKHLKKKWGKDWEGKFKEGWNTKARD